jgi:cysteinyl-tRNA synthetase
MVRSLLGQEIDLHTGGEDHIAVHHNNEIAQSEAASGRTFVHYWMHNAFLTMSGEKASKSLGNVVYLADLIKKGIHPLALRYLFLQAHYRTQVSFSWDALGGAAVALERLWKLSLEIAEESKRISAPSSAREDFLVTMRDDLATPQAISILWESLRSEENTPEEKWGLIEAADAHLGLSLIQPPVKAAIQEEHLPEEIRAMLREREAARSQKDFAESDRLRSAIERAGYSISDGQTGQVLTRATL